MITYELHTLKNEAIDKEWKVTAVFEDIELARHDATRMDETGRYAGIRLIEEKHNEVTGKTEIKTIFRGGVRFNAAKERSFEKPGSPKRDVDDSLAELRRARAGGTRAGGSQKGGMSTISILLLSLVFGVAAMYALYTFVPD